MKIDTSKFENYANLTAEEKVALLEGFEFTEPQADNSSADEISRLRNAISKSNSEASSWKKKYESTLSEQERLEAERQQREADREARIAELEKEKAIGDYTAKYLAVGYSAELAKSSALAMAEGNKDQVFADMNAFIAEKTKQLQAEALNTQPQITQGSPVVNPAPEDDLTAAFRKAIGL